MFDTSICKPQLRLNIESFCMREFVSYCDSCHRNRIESERLIIEQIALGRVCFAWAESPWRSLKQCCCCWFFAVEKSSFCLWKKKMRVNQQRMRLAYYIRSTTILTTDTTENTEFWRKDVEFLHVLEIYQRIFIIHRCDSSPNKSNWSTILREPSDKRAVQILNNKRKHLNPKRQPWQSNVCRSLSTGAGGISLPSSSLGVVISCGLHDAFTTHHSSSHTISFLSSQPWPHSSRKKCRQCLPTNITITLPWTIFICYSCN